MGFAGALRGLLAGVSVSLQVPWSVPLASFHLAIDPLAAFFLLPTFALSGLAAVYGAGYFRSGSHPVPRGAWLWFNLLVASMAVVVAARNGVLFLIAWEVMTLASYFLVTLHHDHAGSRRAGRVYLVATHIGTAFLLVFFLALPGAAGSLDFDSAAPGAVPLLPTSALFLLAVVGFGTKAGFMPLHVWLPEAHPAAPSHVSAVMSGVMIKMGIYGLVRMLPYLGPPPPWWGWLLIAVGLVSGILGVLYALAQHELKRLLAYHSIENIGIITCGLGLGLLGEAAGEPWLAALGFGGALLHVVNHAVFKGLLFLGAGSVLHGSGTGEIEHLGGLLRRMPWTAAAFLVGAIAISGLPPLNGFVSEFLIYLGSFRAAAGSAGPVALAGIVLIAGLALIGGLAAACFVKAFGISFLGEPRSAAAREARESGLLMRIPMAVLAAACLAIGLGSPWVLRALAPVVPQAMATAPVAFAAGALAALPAGASGVGAAPAASVIPAAAGILAPLAGVAGAFVALALLLAALRAGILARRGTARTVTWDCGYAAPGARMQYTASSFAQPILEMVAPILGTRVSSLKPSGLFPEKASHATATPDTFRERVVAPITAEIGRRVAPFRRIQEGRVQVYVLYIALTLLAVLLYQFLVNP
ncbi:MAG: proton-conducting transporter membrane subunit [Bacteroidota bacterium]